MLLLVRHGSTDLNNETHERIRSWGPYPLSLKGMKESQAVARHLAKTKPYAIYTSPLVRAVQTADDIGDAQGMVIEPRDELMDWNVGDYIGEPVKKVLNELLLLIKEPTKKAPGGEAYHTFLYRLLSSLKEFVESPKVCIAVTHNRCATVAHALAKAKGDVNKLDKKLLLEKGEVCPAGVLSIQPDWSFKIIEGHLANCTSTTF